MLVFPFCWVTFNNFFKKGNFSTRYSLFFPAASFTSVALSTPLRTLQHASCMLVINGMLIMITDLSLFYWFFFSVKTLGRVNAGKWRKHRFTRNCTQVTGYILLDQEGGLFKTCCKRLSVEKWFIYTMYRYWCRTAPSMFRNSPGTSAFSFSPNAKRPNSSSGLCVADLLCFC